METLKKLYSLYGKVYSVRRLKYYNEKDSSFEKLPEYPLVFEGGMKTWCALSKWNFDFFEEEYGQELVTVHRPFSGVEKHVDLSGFLGELDSSSEYDPYTLHLKIENVYAELRNDFTVLSCFRNWFSDLNDVVNPHLQWILIGPKLSGTRLHVDMISTSSWNALISGRKYWLFFPPQCIQALESPEVDAFASRVVYSTKFCAPLFCVQKPGDIVFIPSSWWHQVHYSSCSIGLTENFVNNSNVDDVINSLKAQNLLTWEKIVSRLKYFHSRRIN